MKLTRDIAKTSCRYGRCCRADKSLDYDGVGTYSTLAHLGTNFGPLASCWDTGQMNADLTDFDFEF